MHVKRISMKSYWSNKLRIHEIQCYDFCKNDNGNKNYLFKKILEHKQRIYNNINNQNCQMHSNCFTTHALYKKLRQRAKFPRKWRIWWSLFATHFLCQLRKWNSLGHQSNTHGNRVQIPLLNLLYFYTLYNFLFFTEALFSHSYEFFISRLNVLKGINILYMKEI